MCTKSNKQLHEGIIEIFVESDAWQMFSPVTGKTVIVQFHRNLKNDFLKCSLCFFMFLLYWCLISLREQLCCLSSVG